jgi:hypothetical protein
MKTNTLIIGLCSALILAGCTGFNQDPLKDANNAVKNSVDPSTKPVLPKPISEDVVSLEGSEAMTVVLKEGEAFILPLKVKSYLANYTYSFEPLNLANFKDAKFDTVTKNILWTPPRGTIDSGETVKKLEMFIDIIATPINATDKIVLKSSQKIIFIVVNEMVKPVIKDVKFSASTISPLMFAEGTVRYLTVIAEDTESADVAGMQPKLSFNGLVEPYAKVTNTRYLPATNQWEFEVRIDLTNADITKNLSSAPFNIQVLNKYGIASTAFPVAFTVLAKLGAPLSTFDNATTFKVGALSSIPFTIYDAQAESFLTLKNFGSLPAGATISCEASNRIFQQCRMEWTPSILSIGSYTTTLEIETRGSSPADTRPPVKNTIAIAYKVTL